MSRERRFSGQSTVQLYYEREAANLRNQAEGMPLSIRRDELLRNANQAEAASEVTSGTPSSMDG